MNNRILALIFGAALAGAFLLIVALWAYVGW